jgi:UDP-N-acetylmuramoylalanine--D-glutamate ligase
MKTTQHLSVYATRHASGPTFVVPGPGDVAVVIGAGETGQACARYLIARGCRVTVADTRPNPAGFERLSADLPSVWLVPGPLLDETLVDADFIVLSPGVPRSTPAVAAALARGREVIGDIELFGRVAHCPTVGITGSNGKSTVTSMVAAMGQAGGINAVTGGNLGPPALDLLTNEDAEIFVIELSSFQLESTDSLSLLAGALLNVSEDHLDRYATMDDYVNAKLRIVAMCEAMIVPPELASLVRDHGAKAVLTFSADEDAQAQYGLANHQDVLWLTTPRGPLLPLSCVAAPGRHNVANALAAAALAHRLGIDDRSIRTALESFTGLAHRCERVPTEDGRSWINDSKGTNVGATCAAIQGLALDGAITLIAGGQSKGADLSALRPVIERHVHQVILFGEDADSLRAALVDVSSIHQVEALPEAVRLAAEMAGAGETILFSPACASFDQYPNYGVRGEHFRQCVTGETGG